MGFERFKKEMRDKSIEALNKEVQERKKLLMLWNTPVQRQVEVGGYNSRTRMPFTYAKHPFKKARKELAILNTLIHQKMNGWKNSRGKDGRTKES